MNRTKTVDTTVKWQGSDTDELSRKFPPSDIMFADPLFQKEIEGGFIITRFTFERQAEDGSWEEIDDPRRRLTPMTDYERAVDADNRRMFPGDYMNECDRCGCDPCRCEGDAYDVNCTSCDDYGCAKCDPNWCTTCDNEGCATCEPENVCASCKQYCNPQYVSIDKDSGLCESCEYGARLCVGCHHDKHDGPDKLCSGCRLQKEYNAAPKCDECFNVAVPEKGDVCASCQQYRDSLCQHCVYEVADGEDDKLCAKCRGEFTEDEAYWRSYYVWWRRALRRLRLMK